MFNTLKTFKTRLLRAQVWLDVLVNTTKDTRGQDLIEYALMAGFVAVAAGALMPGISSSISRIFSKVATTMANSAAQGS